VEEEEEDDDDDDDRGPQAVSSRKEAFKYRIRLGNLPTGLRNLG
jgi:hypothetical protein